MKSILVKLFDPQQKKLKWLPAPPNLCLKAGHGYDIDWSNGAK
jgi:hypothetical protein